MYCEKCRTEIKEGSVFCPKCGARQKAPGEGTTPGVQASPPVKKSGSSGGMIAGIAVAVVAVAAVIVAVVLFFVRGREALPAQQSGDSTQEASRETDDTDAQDTAELTEESPEVPLYAIEDVPSVDLSVTNYTPGTKQAGMEWDSSLFYWLFCVRVSGGHRLLSENRGGRAV